MPLLYDRVNPAKGTATNPSAAEPEETYATAWRKSKPSSRCFPNQRRQRFAVAAFMGLRHGEIQGRLWENYQAGEMFVSRSIWNGRISDPKTRKGRAPMPVIRQLAERLEIHR